MPRSIEQSSEVGGLTNILRLLNIQHHRLNPLTRKHSNDPRSNPITATRHNHNLPAPIIPVILPVIAHALVKELLHPVEETTEHGATEPLQHLGMLQREFLALGCVERGEVERECLARVEGGVLEDGEDGIECEACDDGLVLELDVVVCGVDKRTFTAHGPVTPDRHLEDLCCTLLFSVKSDCNISVFKACNPSAIKQTKKLNKVIRSRKNLGM